MPPTNSGDSPALAWTSTTLEQEETLARLRWERREQEGQLTAGTMTAMSLDGTPVPTPMQGGDGRWLDLQSQSYMEPYMMSGYEALAPPRVHGVGGTVAAYL